MNQGFCIRRFKMGVGEHAIEFINEAPCKKVCEDSWIGKEWGRSLREKKDVELENVLNKKWLNIRVIQRSALHAWVSGK